MVKFKIGFTIDAETMFHMMSRLLPIRDLYVEELPPDTPHAPPAMPKVSKIAAQVARVQLPPTPVRKHKALGKPVDLRVGSNQIIMEVLADGKEHSASELKPLFVKRGYSANSVSSRLLALAQLGVIKHVGLNWALADNNEVSNEEPERA